MLVPLTGWKLLKIPPMKQAADPNPSCEKSAMRIVLVSSGTGPKEPTKSPGVSVIEASDYVWSRAFTHGCVKTAINVIDERLKANCRVGVAQTESARVIKQERLITNGGVCSGDLIKQKRGVTKSVVAESVNVTKEREGADSRIEVGNAGSEEVIILERAGTHGGVSSGINALTERLKANCRVAVGIAGSEEVIKQERVITHGGVLIGVNIKQKRGIAKRAVVVSVNIANERIVTRGRVEVAGSVAKERKRSSGGVEVASGNAKQRKRTNCCVPKA
jgi:hypothetical protein